SNELGYCSPSLERTVGDVRLGLRPFNRAGHQSRGLGAADSAGARRTKPADSGSFWIDRGTAAAACRAGHRLRLRLQGTIHRRTSRYKVGIHPGLDEGAAYRDRGSLTTKKPGRRASRTLKSAK